MTGLYAEQWKQYRRRHVAASLTLVFGLPLVVALAMVTRWLTGLDAQPMLVFLAVLWALAWGWLAFRTVRFPCPRCGKPFLAPQEPVLGGSRQCVSCGLRLYENA